MGMMRKAGNRGFTFSELMVVVFIIALFAVVLVPVCGNAIASAWDMKCKSNLRLMAQTCIQYAMQHDRFPWGERKVEGYTSYCWDFRKREGEPRYEPGEMWEGVEVGEVVQCPACRKAYDNWDGNAFTGYNYNCAYLGFVQGTRCKRNAPARFFDLQDPSEVALFGDGGYAGGPNKFMRAPKASREYDYSATNLREAGTQAFRHRGHTNVAFCDGHVEGIIRPYTSAGNAGWVSGPARTGFLSPDNAKYGAGHLPDTGPTIP